MAKVKAGDRKENWHEGQGQNGENPVATIAQCLSAIELRHHGKNVTPSSVLSHVQRSQHGKVPRVQAALKKARAADAGKKKKTKKKK